MVRPVDNFLEDARAASHWRAQRMKTYINKTFTYCMQSLNASAIGYALAIEASSGNVSGSKSNR